MEKSSNYPELFVLDESPLACSQMYTDEDLDNLRPLYSAFLLEAMSRCGYDSIDSDASLRTNASVEWIAQSVLTWNWTWDLITGMQFEYLYRVGSAEVDKDERRGVVSEALRRANKLVQDYPILLSIRTLSSENRIIPESVEGSRSRYRVRVRTSLGRVQASTDVENESTCVPSKTILDMYTKRRPPEFLTVNALE